jgi:hypothetical protein
MKTYKGKYRVKNIKKYEGDYSKCTYRSLWERQVFRWLDDHPKVVKWSSEEVVIPYRCKTDGKMHRYFTDLKIRMDNGKTYIIEIKPKAQTVEPKVRSRKTKKYINEVMTYVKNTSKWEAAEEFCENRGWEFAIWHEGTLKSLGIKILT